MKRLTYTQLLKSNDIKVMNKSIDKIFDFNPGKKLLELLEQGKEIKQKTERIRIL